MSASTPVEILRPWTWIFGNQILGDQWLCSGAKGGDFGRFLLRGISRHKWQKDMFHEGFELGCFFFSDLFCFSLEDDDCSDLEWNECSSFKLDLIWRFGIFSVCRGRDGHRRRQEPLVPYTICHMTKSSSPRDYLDANNHSIQRKERAHHLESSWRNKMK